MAYIYKNKGTCSVQTEVELNPDQNHRKASRSWAAAMAT